jgi:nucleoid-associated protein YgaU
MISKRSRYATCALVKEPGVEYLSTRPPVEIPPQPADRFHEVQIGDRLDVLAYKYLGDVKLWWVIAEVNDIAWGGELEIGATLSIPPLEYVEMKVLG